MEAATRFALRRLLPHCRRQPPSSNRTLFSTRPPPSSSFSLFTSIGSSASVPTRLGLLKNLCPKIVEAASSSSSVPRFKSLLLCWNASGRKLLYGSVFGFTMISTGMISDHPAVAYADDYRADHEEPSAYLGDELHTFWTLSKKFQLPIVLLTMVLFGWRHPITLAVNVAMLLFCTRHGPLSVYLFIEQLRQRDMKQGPGLHKSKGNRSCDYSDWLDSSFGARSKMVINGLLHQIDKLDATIEVENERNQILEAQLEVERENVKRLKRVEAQLEVEKENVGRLNADIEDMRKKHYGWFTKMLIVYVIGSIVLFIA